MENRENAYIDWINLVLAVILFLSPWIFGFPAGPASVNAMIAGIVIGVVAIAALVSFGQWEEWVNLILGIWVVISPWVLAFSSTASASWVQVIIGLAVAILAAIELWTMTRNPPAEMASR